MTDQADLQALSDAASDVRRSHAPNEWDSCVACRKQWPCDAEMLAELVVTRLTLRAATPVVPAPNPQWRRDRGEDPPVSPEEAKARLAASPSPATDAGLDVERLARAMCLANGDTPEQADKFWDREVEEAEAIAVVYARLATPDKGQPE